MAAPTALHFTPDPEANRLLADEPLALLVGMLLDQQVTMEAAFRAPLLLRERLGGRLDAGVVASMPPEDLETVFRARPALHRFPAAMAKRTQALCQYLVEHYDGRADRVWADVAGGNELLARVKALPGFGTDKSRIFVGVLGKRLDVRPDGWDAVAADWASIADVDAYERVGEIREKKRAAKAAKPGARPAAKRRATEAAQ